MKKEVIILKGVTKRYIIRHQKPTLIENMLYKQRKEVYTALKDVSFSIREGERIGIVGKNGSGKTTLLKLLAKITKPQEGTLIIKGRTVSLIDLSAGFHPDLTGEENILLNGLVIGMTKREIDAKKDSIIAFADIGKFIDAPLYTYSVGMQLRLGFAIAIYANPDILILDEGFVVGDANFREKAGKKIKELIKQKKTLIMVSHWLEELEKNCNKILWLEEGRLVRFGDKKVIEEYVDSFNR